MAYLLNNGQMYGTPSSLPERYTTNVPTDNISNTAIAQSFPENIRLKGGISTTKYPVEVHHWGQGKYLNKFVDSTIYYRMLTNKVNFNFGIITGEKGEVFSIWNGYDEYVTLTNIINDGVSGATVVPVDGVLPVTIAPYRSVLLQMTLSTQGAAVLNGKFTFIFSNGDKVVTSVFGSRLVLLNIKPNWEDGFTEIFDYKTDVITSFNKKEQRRSLLSQPRRRIQYSGLIKGEVLRQLRNKIYAWHDRAFMIPLWYQRASLLKDITINSTIITVDVQKYDFKVGGNICIWYDFNKNSVFEIIAMNGNELTLNSPVDKEYSMLNSFVYPSITMRMTDSITLNNHTFDVGETDFDLEAEQGTLKLKMPTGSIEASYNGIEILERKPNWANKIDDEYKATTDIIDYNYGIQHWFSRDVPSLVNRTMTFIAKDYNSILWWKAFIQRQRGQFKSFLVPTGTNDLTMVGTYISGNNYIDVVDDYLTTLIGDSKERKYIRVQTEKNVYYCKVTAITAVSGNARLQIEKPIGVKIEITDIIKFSFMNRFRFASDSVEIKYLTDNKAELNLTFKQVREVT